jgi:nitroreductase
MNPFTEIIKNRRSVRKFHAKPIANEIVRDILDCARMAPNARNIQAWLFGAITNKGLREKIAELADYGTFIKKAPLCFAVFYDAKAKYLLEDGCAATMNILLACSAHGIASCWVAGHKKRYANAVRELLRVPDCYALISLIPAGYSDEKPTPKKKNLDEIVFCDTYDEKKCNVI